MAKFQGTSSKRTSGIAKKKSAIGDKIKLKNKSREGKSHHSMNPNRPKESAKGVSNPRSAGTIKRLQMYRCSKARRNKDGKIVKPAAFQSHVNSGTQSRLEPSRAWFSNTKVIGQTALQNFQTEMAKAAKDPYQVVMRKTGLPVTLLNEKAKHSRVHILDTQSFEDTFGKKASRKRPRIQALELSELVASAAKAEESYDPGKDKDLFDPNDVDGVIDANKENIFGAGASKRIWNEVYKVIDSSDVVIQVLDARDPMGTRSKHIEKYMKKEKAHKHLILVLNKVDLIPTWVTQKWVAVLSAEYPTVAFHASLRHPFGKGAVISLLRQFGKLHKESKQISVGLIGYPNVGKSSVINALRSKKVCNVAPLAGETKVWQYITLFRKIYLIDCPGVVHGSGNETDEEKVLKGVVRVEMVEQPSDYVPAVMKRVKKDYMARTYRLSKPWDWTTTSDFLERVARQSGKLLKGGEPDLNTVGKMILNDWQRGKIPYFSLPTGCELPPTLDNTISNVKLCNDGSAEETEVVKQTNKKENEVNENEDLSKIDSINDTDKEVDTTVSTEMESNTESTESDGSNKKGSLINKNHIEHPDQDFRKIKVKIDFDEEDRRGDPEYVENGEESLSEGEDVDEDSDENNDMPSEVSLSTINPGQPCKKQKLKLNKINNKDKKESLSNEKKKRPDIKSRKKSEMKSPHTKDKKTVKSSSGKFKVSDI